MPIKKYKTKTQARKARNRRASKWGEKNLKTTILKFHKVNDKEVIDKLDSVDNKTDYVRTLIKNDIKEGE